MERMKWFLDRSNDSKMFIIYDYTTYYSKGSGYGAGYIQGVWRSGFSSSRSWQGEECTPPPNWQRGMLEFMMKSGFEELIENGSIKEFKEDLKKL